jgi:hypothetical protein
MGYDVSRAFERIENELLESMTRNLKKHKAEETELGIEWTQWQAIQLEDLHRFKQEAAKKYGLEFKSMNKKIRETIANASLQGASDEELNVLKALEKGYVLKRERGLSAGFFQTNQKRLDALMNAVEHDMKTAQTAVLRYANDQYRKIIFQSQVAASSGALTYEKAVDMATSDFLKNGINCITYSNGAVHNIVSYADMAVRTASKRAYLMGEGQKRQEWGVSTVILNKRFNACPLCMPFEGKVLIDDVWSGGSSKDGPYPLMSSAMAAGLYHPNCKDKHSTYFEGISSKPESRYYEEKPVIKERQLIENKLNHAKRQAKSYNRLAKNSLDAENQETYRARATEWDNNVKQYREQLDSFEEKNGLELKDVLKQARKHDLKVNITPQAIEKVPLVNIPALSDVENRNIQLMHKQLLEDAMKNNHSNEVAYILSKNGVSKVYGTENTVDFAKSHETELLLKLSPERSLDVLHNHPKGSTFSLEDIDFFVRTNSVRSLTIVTNQGKVMYLIKTKKVSMQKMVESLYNLTYSNDLTANIDKIADSLYTLGVKYKVR